MVAKLNSTNFDVCLVFCLNFICLFLAALCLHCAPAFSGCGKLGVGYSPAFVGRLLIVLVSLVAEQSSRVAGSVVLAHRLSCLAACGIFPDQGSNPCLALGRWILNHWTPREAL